LILRGSYHKVYKLLVLALISCSCSNFSKNEHPNDHVTKTILSGVSIIVLGNVQDAGSPHIGCTKDCCKEIFEEPDKTRKVVSLGLVDPEYHKSYIFDATPDFPEQMKLLKKYSDWNESETPDGIFITHAHIGHYTGLMYLGKEAMNASEIPVFAMPKMKSFLEQNGPWSQLVNYKNILLIEINKRDKVVLTPSITVIPFTVPHRDEFSETVGYKIQGPKKNALFIPDIDKWSRWERSIVEEISNVDYAFLDATFYDAKEIGYRDISEIPHPFIVESMELFKELPANEKSKVYFIHLNHTNPVLNPGSPQSTLILENGFNVARFYDEFAL